MKKFVLWFLGVAWLGWWSSNIAFPQGYHLGSCSSIHRSALLLSQKQALFNDDVISVWCQVSERHLETLADKKLQLWLSFRLSVKYFLSYQLGNECCDLVSFSVDQIISPLTNEFFEKWIALSPCKQEERRLCICVNCAKLLSLRLRTSKKYVLDACRHKKGKVFNREDWDFCRTCVLFGHPCQHRVWRGKGRSMNIVLCHSTAPWIAQPGTLAKSPLHCCFSAWISVSHPWGYVVGEKGHCSLSTSMCWLLIQDMSADRFDLILFCIKGYK